MKEVTPLIDKEKIEETYISFCKSMTTDIPKSPSYLAYRRHTEKKEEIRHVCWNEELGIWSFFLPTEKLYWCPVGVQDPSTSSQDTSKLPRLIITCLIDFPCEGINRRVNGLFVRDEEGNIYVTHKGNFGGGAKGISGSSFRNSEQYKKEYSENIIKVSWPDGKKTETICIGELEDPELPRKVSNFVKDVRHYKDDVYRKRDNEIII